MILLMLNLLSFFHDSPFYFFCSTTRSTYGKGTFSLSSDLPANTYNKAPFFKAYISLVIPLVVNIDYRTLIPWFFLRVRIIVRNWRVNTSESAIWNQNHVNKNDIRPLRSDSLLILVYP